MPSLQPVFLRFPQGLRVGAHTANLEETGLHLPLRHPPSPPLSTVGAAAGAIPSPG